MSEDDVAKVREALAAQAVKDGDGKANGGVDVVSTYYDTPDLALQRRHLTLRVREQEGRFIQTVKSDALDGSNVLARGEWEEPIAGAGPEPGAPKTGRHLPKEIKQSGLRPLFTTHVKRTTMEVRPHRSSHVEAAIDVGEIRAADGHATEPIREVELEMKRGDPSDIYDLALQLLEIAPLEIGTRSKADRGYGLVDADLRVPKAQRQKPIELDPGCTSEAALQAIGGRCLGHFLSNIPAALADDPEGVHQMRVATRRLRSLLSAAKPMLPSGQRRWVSDELRFLGDSLGSARNWDSFMDALLPAAEGGLSDKGDLEMLRRGASEQRRQAHEEAKSAIRSKHYAQSVLRLLRWFETASWRDEISPKQAKLLSRKIEDTAPRLLERCRRQVKRRSTRFTKRTPVERHKLRIALKKLRYAVSFFASLYPRRRVRQFIERLKPLQDSLGYANDVRVAHDLIATLQRTGGQQAVPLARGGGLVLGWHERGVADQEAVIAKAIRSARRAKPVWV